MEIQVFARHNRFGNLNPRTYSFLLYAEGNEREMRMITNNAVRKKVGTGALQGGMKNNMASDRTGLACG
jgi:hypothetical protein